MPKTGGQVLKTVLTNGGVIPCGAGLVFLAHSAIRLRFSAARERPPEKDRRKKSALSGRDVRVSNQGVLST